MTEFMGWVRCAGRRVLVHRVDEVGRFDVVSLCVPCGPFGAGHELRVPKGSFLACAARTDENGDDATRAAPRLASTRPTPEPHARVVA